MVEGKMSFLHDKYIGYRQQVHLYKDLTLTTNISYSVDASLIKCSCHLHQLCFVRPYHSTTLIKPRKLWRPPERDPGRLSCAFSNSEAGSSSQTISELRKKNVFFLLVFCTFGKPFSFAWMSPSQVSILVENQISYALTDKYIFNASGLFFSEHMPSEKKIPVT